MMRAEEGRVTQIKPFALVAMNGGMRRNEIMDLTRQSHAADGFLATSQPLSALTILCNIQ
jgi:hypothetical protein